MRRYASLWSRRVCASIAAGGMDCSSVSKLFSALAGLFGLRFRFVDLRGAGEQRLAALIPDEVRDGYGGEVLGWSAGHFDAVAGFQRISRPSPAHQSHGAGQLEAPVH